VDLVDLSSIAFGISIAFGDGNAKIRFLKVCLRRTFKKRIFIMRIADCFNNAWVESE
jgi:hypothetical protein